MSARASTCPNCGAPVVFRWSSSVQTVCTFCRSILVRSDVDVERVGTVADLPANPSPIQVGTEGVYLHEAFTVTGRILYEYDAGGWNEWHLVFRGDRSGWLADAQAEYDISFLCAEPGPLPPAEAIRPDQRFRWQAVDYQVTALTRARYRGVEGELPFQYWDKQDVLFADLRSTDGRFATIDYSDPQPRLFLGASVEFNDLQFKNLRQLEGW
jgi:uncharacterized protein DUF4178